MKGKGKMPNEGTSKGGRGGTNTGASTGLKMSNDMRADVRKAPSNKNPFPKGLS